MMEKVWGWSFEECCKVRKVWLTYRDLPLYGWTKRNVERIREVWGRVICSD